MGPQKIKSWETPHANRGNDGRGYTTKESGANYAIKTDKKRLKMARISYLCVRQ